MSSLRGVKIVLWIGVIVFLSGAGYVVAKYLRHRSSIPVKVTTITTPVPTLMPTDVPSPQPSPIVRGSESPTATPSPALPATINLDVPFTIQAPSQNWDAFHEETCEEAAILIAQWYAFGKQGVKEGSYANHIPVAEAEKSLSDIVAWERNNLSDWKDTTAAETIRIAKEFLGMHKVTLLDAPTSESIKRELAKSNVVVVPTAGRLLQNPHFKQPGPPYHMIVIRGYSDQGFITNDPGIREGEGYVYKESILLNAIHDWTGSADTINNGQKKAIVVGLEP